MTPDEMEELIAQYKEKEKLSGATIGKLQNQNEELSGKIEEAKQMKAKAESMQNENVARALELENEKRNHKMALLQLELDLTKAGKEDILALNKIVFQNRTVRETVTSLGINQNQPGTTISVQDQYGMSHQQWIPTAPPVGGSDDSDKVTTEG